MAERAASGATPIQVVLEQAASNVLPLDESSDGKLVVFSSGLQGRRSLHILSRVDGKVTTYMSGEFDYTQASLSHDGKWLAFVSNESGTYEVVVQSFPDPSGGKWPISSNGGLSPRWRRDGKELFYIDGERRLVAAPITTSPKFAPGRPVPLFSLPGRAFASPSGAAYMYDAAPDGQRFLVSFPTTATSRITPLTVTLNWGSLVKK
jgi:Tol biopolymer transport system component